jgi:hypothetical protein
MSDSLQDVNDSITSLTLAHAPKLTARLEARSNAMHRAAFQLALSTILLFTARQGSAQTPVKPPPPEDIRCVIVAMQLSVSNDPAQRTGGSMLAMYYVGRLDQYPAKVLEDAIFKELPAMTPDLFKFEAGRCGGILIEKGQVLTQIGKNITQRAQEPQKHVPPAASPPTPQPETKPNEK